MKNYTEENQKAYKQSNALLVVGKSRFAKDIKDKYNALLGAGESRTDRQTKAQDLLDALCGAFGMPKTKISVNDKPQAHSDTATGKLKRKVHGYYTTGKETINVYNLTAKRQQVVAIKTFTDTVLHEFMHHYDMEYLKLSESYHTLGFYKRITDLKNKLGA